jgi:hypothetical protein
MSMDSDQLLVDRFARLAPQADAPDWADVQRRARRLRPPSSGRAPRRVLLVAAILVALFALAGGALALSGVSLSGESTGVPQIDRMLDRSTRSFLDVPPGSPLPQFQPQRGSVSEKLRFQFRGHHYTAVGFRVKDGSVCSALVEPLSMRANGGIGCNGARFLRRSLARDPVHLSGVGGGDETGQQTIANGFAREEVVSLALTGAAHNGVVALSEAWRPAGKDGEPIRFFYVVMDTEPAGPRAPLLPEGLRIEALLDDGSLIEIPR